MTIDLEEENENDNPGYDPNQSTIDDLTDYDHSYAIDGEDKKLVNDALEYLSGYVCHKTNQDLEAVDTTDSWVAKVSEGGLKIPDERVQEAVMKLETIFKCTNGTKICERPGIMARMLDQANSIQISDKFKKKFLRTRLYIRIRFLNKLTQQNALEKIKRNKNKIKKTIK